MAVAVLLSRGGPARLCVPYRLARGPRQIGRLLRVGIPIGLFPAIDVAGLAAFQAMQVAAGAVGGAATQIVMMLTSIAYLPTMGFALAGTTLVGQIHRGGRQGLGNASGQCDDCSGCRLHGFGHGISRLHRTLAGAAVR